MNKVVPDAILMGCTYQSEAPVFECGDRLYIVDFSFSVSVMQGWSDRGIEVTVIDHHETALNNLSGLSDRITAKFDMSHCGATLTWKHFFPDKEMPAFLEYVRDRDLWSFLLPHSQEIHEAVSHLKYSQKKYQVGSVFDLFDALEKLNAFELETMLLPIGAALLQPKKEKIEAVAGRHEWHTLAMPYPEVFAGDFYIPVVKLAKDGSEDRLVSDICMKMYRDMPNADFVACITSDGSWSLRSDKNGNNFNVRMVAEQFGGGGHRNAAGFRLDS